MGGSLGGPATPVTMKPVSRAQPIPPHRPRPGSRTSPRCPSSPRASAPSGIFWVSLAGGIALARAAATAGLRRGSGAAAAAMLQTVAVMGPARINGPLTQALSAPAIGRLHARGAGVARQVAATFAIRLTHYTILSALFIWVVLGGLDAYVGSYDRLTGWLGILPSGANAALALGMLSNVVWALVYSVLQVIVYRRALADWPDEAPAGPGAPPAVLPAGADAGPGRFDPRALALAAALATGLLLTSTAWPLLAGVSAWLVVAWVAARAGREAIPLGLALAALLAFAALTGGLLAGLGAEEAASRALRAALLVATATWLRAAAGPEGLREVFRRTLRRLHRLPAAREAGAVLDGLDAGPRLVAAGRGLLASLAAVPRRPLPIADAVIAWVAAEAVAFRAGDAPARRAAIAVRARDGALVALALAPGLALVGSLG